jgi:hypothetical protein
MDCFGESLENAQDGPSVVAIQGRCKLQCSQWFLANLIMAAFHHERHRQAVYVKLVEEVMMKLEAADYFLGF